MLQRGKQAADVAGTAKTGLDVAKGEAGVGDLATSALGTISSFAGGGGDAPNKAVQFARGSPGLPDVIPGEGKSIFSKLNDFLGSDLGKFSVDAGKEIIGGIGTLKARGEQKRRREQQLAMQNFLLERAERGRDERAPLREQAMARLQAMLAQS